MKKLIVILGALLITVAAYIPCPAEDSDYICEMDERIQELETRVKQLEGIIEKAGLSAPREEKPAARGGFGDKVSVSGVLEAEAGIADVKMLSGDSVTVSDIVLATVGLNLEAAINEKIYGNLNFLWEEDDTEPISVDIGTITYRANTFDLTIGRFYPMFGTFNCDLITDPLTLELGEIQESGIMFTTSILNNVEAALAIANGDIDNSTMGGNAGDFGVSLTFHNGYSEDNGWDFKTQYYSDIADSDADILNGNAPSKTVGGVAANLDWTDGLWKANVELVSAARRFAPGDLDNNGDGAGDRPEAWHFGLSRQIKTNQTLTFTVETSEEFFDFPELRLGIASHWDLRDDVCFGLEYLYSEYDDSFSSGVKNSHALNSQLAIEF